MNEKIKTVVTTVKTKWTDSSKMAKILIISIPVVVIAIIIVLCVLLNSNKSTAVLFSGLQSSEAGEIAAAISAVDSSAEVTVNSNGDIIVPAEKADSLRMQMWAQGYPKSTTNYDIWNNGVDLWSTDMDKREVKRQQLEARLGATIASLDKIQSATANITLPETSNYAISTEKGDSQCAVFIQLKNDAEPLTNAEIRAIYRGVTTSVEGLKTENVSIMDSKMNSYEWVDPELDNLEDDDEDKSGVDIARKRLEFEQEFVQVLKDGLGDMFTKIYGEDGYAFNVSARLNYDARDVESTQYSPVEGTNAGVINHQDKITSAGTLNEDGGIVGVTANGDISPDYPTYNGLEDGQTYYYNKEEIQYSVSNITETIKKDGYNIDSLSVGLVVNQTNMTAGERQALQEIVANAAGTSVDYVSVYNLPFSLNTAVSGDGSGNGLQIITPPVDTFRNTLLYVVVALGVLLILLLILTLMMGHSRKKKIRRRQEAAFAAAAANGGAAQNGATAQEPESPEEVDFNIASLTEEAAKESRETILKREISDFSKTNPEIVAQIIKNMMKSD